MALGTEVGVGLGGIVLDGESAPRTERGTAAPTFRPTVLWYRRPSQQLLSSCSRYSDIKSFLLIFEINLFYLKLTFIKIFFFQNNLLL